MALGIYSDSPCYDRNRPSWLPYEIDTWSESLCKWERRVGLNTTMQAPPNPPPIHLAAPETEEQMVNPGEWTPQIAANETRTEYISETNKVIEEYLKTIKSNPTWLIIGAIAVVGLLAYTSSPSGSSVTISLLGGGGRKRKKR